MDDLLTTRDVLDILSIDRTTVYRMLKDGRLSGMKIGQQWRFPRHEIDMLLRGLKRTSPATKTEPNTRNETDHPLPVQDVQPIQDVFAELAEVGAITTDMDGQALTEISNSGIYCKMIRSTESGRRACSASWRDLARRSEQQTDFFVCHAGLSYASARINITDAHPAQLVTGQFYADLPDWDEEKKVARETAVLHGLNKEAMAEAITKISVFNKYKRTEIHTWLSKTANSLEHSIRERVDLSRRLRAIAQMSNCK